MVQYSSKLFKMVQYCSVLLLTILVSCEVIPEGERFTEVFTPSDTSQIKRASLLIEYSGWRCMNCPNAAEVAHELKAQYGEDLVVVVMHPASNPNTRYGNNQALNFTCPEADSIYISMGGTNTTPFPTGNVNGEQQGGNYFMGQDTWATQISKYYGSSLMKMSQVVACANDEIDVTVEICNMGGNNLRAQLQIWLTEDGVVGKQIMPTGETNNEYEHNHLMRASVLPSVWGEEVELTSMTPTIYTSHYKLPEKVVAENCNVVSVVSVDGVVVQVKETKINKQ